VGGIPWEEQNTDVRGKERGDSSTILPEAIFGLNGNYVSIEREVNTDAMF